MGYTSRFLPPSSSQLSQAYNTLKQQPQLDHLPFKEHKDIKDRSSHPGPWPQISLILPYTTTCAQRETLCPPQNHYNNASKKDKDNFVHQTDVSDDVKPFPSKTQDD